MDPLMKRVCYEGSTGGEREATAATPDPRFLARAPGWVTPRCRCLRTRPGPAISITAHHNSSSYRRFCWHAAASGIHDSFLALLMLVYAIAVRESPDVLRSFSTVLCPFHVWSSDR